MTHASPRGHADGAGLNPGAASSVLGTVARAAADRAAADDAYRQAVLGAVVELERAGVRGAYVRVAEAAGVTRQSVRELVTRARG